MFATLTAGAGVEYVFDWPYSTYYVQLTLTVSQEVAERAKQLAKRRGTSVSKMVEAFLDKASRGEEDVKPESVLREIQAMLKNSTATMDDYYKHLDEKYR